MKRHLDKGSQKGMALVITLMMLAITTFMAVTFLSLSRRERSNVKTVEEQLNARSMAEIANARAQADLTAAMNHAVEADFAQYSAQYGPTNYQKHLAIANRRVQRALLSYDLRTSRNFFNPRGFLMSEGKNPWNVSYFDEKRNALRPGSDEWYQNIANLQYDPRPPVIVSDRGTNDFRFYIDLNRNGMFDPTEWRTITGPNNEIYDAKGKVITSGTGVGGPFVGDPEWIGVLERPDLPHSETNRFIGRYAYLMMPTGKSLDINFIHNLAVYDGSSTTLNYDQAGRSPRFSRNQGVGSWELNMAGFLMDLHTNVWKPDPRFYSYASTNAASGEAFRDAFSLLRYRLNESRANLLTPQEVFGTTPSRWANDLVDMAGDGPIIPYNRWYSSRPIADFSFASLDNDLPTRYWHGAEKVDKTAEFPDVQRYFRLNRNTFSDMFAFYGRFTNAMSSIRTNSYDRYTYYRLLAQMGADSRPALDGKIHLNFTNEPGRLSSNLVSWVSVTNGSSFPTTLPRLNTAALVRRSDGGEEYQTRPDNRTNFFLMAADAMLRASLYTNVFIERYLNNDINQPVWRTNYTVGSPYFEHPELSAVIDFNRVRRIIATPVRPDISITNIQVYYHQTNNSSTWRPNDLTYTNNEYSAAVHRILQLAANIYDNMTNNAGRTGGTRDVNDPFFPTVWRPLYNITETNITIIGWEPQINAGYALNHALAQSTNLFRSPAEYFVNRNVFITNVSFYGQPWVIGVKKGWPNFNELSIETHAQITRKLEVLKSDAEKGKPIALTNYADLVNRTRQILVVGLSNSVGIEAWNSYARTNNRAIRIDTRVETRVGIDRVLARDTNRSVVSYLPVYVSPSNFVAQANSFIIPAGPGPNQGWPGRQPRDFEPKPVSEAVKPNGDSDFRVPIYQSFTILTNQQYSERLDPQPFGTFFANPAQWQSITTTQDFVISITNRVRYLATDVEENRVLDYVTFDNLVTKVDLDEAMREGLNAGTEVGGAGFNPALMWSKEAVVKGDTSGMSFGIMKQIEASLGIQPLSEAQWKDYSATARNEEEILKFQLYMYGTNNGAMSSATAAQVPFSPSRNLFLVSAYQANDPLVHYMPEDLRDRRRTTRPMVLKLTQRAQNGEIGQRNTFRQSIRADKKHGVEFQDPHVYESDDWQFPIAKLDGPGAYGIKDFHYRYPNIGALGQIHRGTPWQTVYLKSRLPENVDPTTTTNATWVDWAGSYGTSPETDRKLIGLFTTAMSENAARGLLSVNQTNIAAWSAVLSGVPVITNSWKNNEIRNNVLNPKFGVGSNGDDLLIQPNSPQLAAIVKGINDYRATRPLGLFGYLGEILGTPQLSIGPNWPNNNGIYASPFLNLSRNQVLDNNGNPDYAAFTDEAIEAIPARVLSLLKEDEPRVTIYCFGQTLKPAPRSFVTSADYYNLCANYQVTGEYVTKAIVRVEGDIDPRDIAIENDKNITDAQRREWKLQRRPLKTVVESFEVLPPFE